jgi:hypothetical protein
MFSSRIARRANFANAAITATRRAKFSAIKNDLEMQIIPAALFEYPL